MAVNLLFLCVFCQAIITAFGATLPIISRDTVVTTKLLPSPPTGRTLPPSPKVPSRASDILTEYLKSWNSGTDLPSSSPIGITLPSLPPVPSKASDLLLECSKYQYPENVLPSSSSPTRVTLPSSPKVPSKACDVLLDYCKNQYPTIDLSLSSKTPLKTEPRYSSTSSACSICLPPPSKSDDTKAFSTVSYPSSLPVVDIYKTTVPKTYAPISTLPLSNSFSLTSITSLPMISSDALKKNVDSLNRVSKLAFPSINHICEDKIIGSLPSVNLQNSLPYPLQYKLQSLPKVVTPPVTYSLNLSSPKYAPIRPLYNQQALPKLNSGLVNKKSNSFNSKTAPKVPVSTKTFLKASDIINSDQTLPTDPINSLRDQLVMNPVEPFAINNLEIISSLGSPKNRLIIPNNVLDEPKDDTTNINLNPNLLKVSNALLKYSNSDSKSDIKLKEIAQRFSSTDILIPNIAEIPIPNATTCTQSVPDFSPSTILHVPSYTQIIPANYLNLSPFLSSSLTSPSSSVSDILSNILCYYMPYLISTRKNSRKPARVLPLNPYPVPKPTQSSSIFVSPKLTLPISSLTTKNQVACPLLSASTSYSLGPSIMNSQSIDMPSLYYDFCSPSLTSYSPVITTPIAQVKPLLPLTVSWSPPVSFVDYSPSQLCSRNLPSLFLPSYSEFPTPVTVEPQIVQVKSSDKFKSLERLLEFVCLAELIKGNGLVNWDAVEMALALLSALQ